VRKLKWGLCAAAGLLAAAVIACGTWVWSIRAAVRNLDQAAAQIAVGDDAARVESVLGPPDRIRLGSEQFTPASSTRELIGEPSRSIVQNFYTVDTPYLPVTWVLGFDEHQRVVTRFRLD
jgi:hypothetical protein